MMRFGRLFVFCLPVRTVGVMGDARSYEFVCALRAVKASDGMTAEHYPFSHFFFIQSGNANHKRSKRHQSRGL